MKGWVGWAVLIEVGRKYLSWWKRKAKMCLASGSAAKALELSLRFLSCLWVPCEVCVVLLLCHTSLLTAVLCSVCLLTVTPNHFISRNVSWLCETVRYPFWRLAPHSIDTLFWTTMSDPKDVRENHLKHKFEALPDQVTIADRPRNKHRGGLRLEFMISRYQININLNPWMAVASI